MSTNMVIYGGPAPNVAATTIPLSEASIPGGASAAQ